MSLTVSLQFPAGRYSAASWGDKDSVEWPPHPARLCLGLIDVLHKAGNSSELREALLWLCQQEAPEIMVPASALASESILEGVFVPQNPSVADGSLKHPRKQRSFPVVFLNPDEPTVFFHWPAAALTPEIAASLGCVLTSLPRLGHSSSFVIAKIDDASPPQDERWRVILPLSELETGTPSFRLRVPWHGLLKSAEDAYDADGRREEMNGIIEKASCSARVDRPLKPPASPRARHDPWHRWQGYEESGKATHPSTGWENRILVLEQTGGDRLGLESTWQLAEVFHKTLIDRWSRSFDEKVPSWISGHAEGTGSEKTAPSASTHLAMFPLPFIDSEHAKGHLLGLGLAFPKAEILGIESSTMRLEWRRAMSTLFHDRAGLELSPRDRAWSIRVAVSDSPKPRQALTPSRWTRAAKVWSSVTPIILDRHPKPHFKKDPVRWRESCVQIIGEACERIGLPRPESIEVSPYSPITGVPAASRFAPPASRAGRPSRFHIHATLHFDEDVAGPVLLGAGRFRGYGLCLPQFPDLTNPSHE